MASVAMTFNRALAALVVEIAKPFVLVSRFLRKPVNGFKCFLASENHRKVFKIRDWLDVNDFLDKIQARFKIKRLLKLFRLLEPSKSIEYAEYQ